MRDARVLDISRVIRVYNGRKIGASITYGSYSSAHELIYKWSGNSVSRIGGEEFMLEQDSILYIPKGEHGEYMVKTLRNGEAIDLFLELDAPLSDKPFIMSARRNAQAKALFEKCHEAWLDTRTSRRLRCMACAYGIIAEMQDMALSYRLPETEKRVMDEAMEYINAHLFDARFDYLELAARTGMSYSYMKRILISRLGVPPSKYILNRRMQYAKDLLLYPEYSVSRIARSVGFENAYYFSRVFKRAAGVSPTEYRRRML